MENQFFLMNTPFFIPLKGKYNNVFTDLLIRF